MPLGLFALALGVRLVGLTWGLPSALHFYSYHPDERQIAVAVANLDFFGGDFNPDFFSYPSLYIYLVYIAHFLGSGLGLFSAPPNNVIWPFLREVMLTGRFVSAMLGAATVPLIFFIGKRIGGARLGTLAALLLAFLPGHVQHSHFATVDVAATFFIARLWLFALDGDVPDALLADVQAFCATWASHGRPVRAAAERLAGRVLAVAAQITDAEVNAGVSGCGIDAMQHAVEVAVARYGRALVPALTVTYRDGAGAWQTVARPAFRRLARSGGVDADTRVLDLTLPTLGALTDAGGTDRPAGEAWHGVAFGLNSPVAPS